MDYVIGLLAEEMNMLSTEQNRIMLASEMFPGDDNLIAINLIKSRYLELSDAIEILEIKSGKI